MTASLTPFPIGGTTGDDGLTGTVDMTGWVATGDDVIKDCWTVTSSIKLDVDMLAYWGNDPEVEQSPAARSTRLTKTITGLPANRIVTVTADVAFYRKGDGAAGKFVGMIVDGTKSSPNVGPSGGIVPNNGTVTGRGLTNGDGELTLAFGADDITVSCELLIFFSNITVEIPPTSAELADIIIDSAVLIVNGLYLSISRGGISFDPGEEWTEYRFPGRTMNVVGCRELTALRPALRGSVMMFGETQILAYRPGGSWADHASIEGARTYTPGTLRTALSVFDYLQDVFCVWKRLRGDYIAVKFDWAIVSSYSIGANDNDEGLASIVIEAAQRLTTGTTKTTVPYTLHLLPTTVTVSDLSDGSAS